MTNLSEITWKNQNTGALWQMLFALLEKADTDLMEQYQTQIPPEVLGQLLMAASRQTLNWHKFWIDVMHQVGPDSLAEISHAVDFMKKANEF